MMRIERNAPKGPTNGKVVAKTKTKLVMVATCASM